MDLSSWISLCSLLSLAVFSLFITSHNKKKHGTSVTSQYTVRTPSFTCMKNVNRSRSEFTRCLSKVIRTVKDQNKHTSLQEFDESEYCLWSVFVFTINVKWAYFVYKTVTDLHFNHFGIILKAHKIKMIYRRNFQNINLNAIYSIPRIHRIFIRLSYL